MNLQPACDHQHDRSVPLLSFRPSPQACEMHYCQACQVYCCCQCGLCHAGWLEQACPQAALYLLRTVHLWLPFSGHRTPASSGSFAIVCGVLSPCQALATFVCASALPLTGTSA